MSFLIIFNGFIGLWPPSYLLMKSRTEHACFVIKISLANKFYTEILKLFLMLTSCTDYQLNKKGTGPIEK